MTTLINMNPGFSAQGGVGVGIMTSAGNPWSATDALAAHLVNTGAATFFAPPGLLALTPQDVICDLTNPVTGVTGVAEQILKQFLIPANLLNQAKYFSFKALFGKSGNTDTMTTRFRLGVTGTVSDASVAAVSATAPNRGYSWDLQLFAQSLTNIRFAASGSNGGWGNGGSSTAYPQDLTVPNLQTNNLILSLTATMGGTTDTPTAAGFVLTLNK